MPRDNYRGVKIPETLMERVDRYLATNDEGFTSIPEVVKAAIRDFLREHEVAAQHKADEADPDEESERGGPD